MFAVPPQEEHFPFLKPVDNTRHRTTFYTALARLLFMSESTDAFTQFMEPINHVLTALKTTVHVRSEKVMVRALSDVGSLGVVH